MRVSATAPPTTGSTRQRRSGVGAAASETRGDGNVLLEPDVRVARLAGPADRLPEGHGGAPHEVLAIGGHARPRTERANGPRRAVSVIVSESAIDCSSVRTS